MTFTVRISRYYSVGIAMLLIAAQILLSCKADVPDGILSPSEMESVLYDYHLAQGLAESSQPEQITKSKNWKYNEHYFIKAALSKHGLTQEDFDKSLEWYTRHSDLLFDIYKRLNERTAAEAGSSNIATGSSVGNTASGDTTDIWHGARAYLLSSTAVGHISFEQQADTLLRAGDRLTLRFNTSWIYREGSKEAMAQLALVYEGDSIVVKSQNIFSNGVQEITTRIGDKPLVAVRGFIYQKAEWSAKPKLLVLTNVALLRLRDKASETLPETDVSQELEKNSTKLPPTAEQQVRDSLRRDDSLRFVRPHFK